MNNHPHAISQLTAAHSRDLLNEGRRRQLAKTAAPKPSRLSNGPACSCTRGHRGPWLWPAHSYLPPCPTVAGVGRRRTGRYLQ